MARMLLSGVNFVSTNTIIVPDPPCGANCRALVGSDIIWHEWAGSKYMRIWWNDVDYALVLAALVVGYRADVPVGRIFELFRDLRISEVTRPRMSGCQTGATSAFLGFAGTFLTGGLLAPLTLPMIVGGMATGMAFDISSTELRRGERSRWERRVQACRNLVRRFPQLEAVLSLATDGEL